MRGVYLLITYLNKNRKITIGRLETKYFKKGYYVYVGSALNNLEKRILRHKSKNKKLRWHIDYFLKYGKIVNVFPIKTDRKVECKISNKINKISNGKIKYFGCSDCKCESHLYYFNKNPLSKLKNEI